MFSNFLKCIAIATITAIFGLILLGLVIEYPATLLLIVFFLLVYAAGARRRKKVNLRQREINAENLRQELKKVPKERTDELSVWGDYEEAVESFQPSVPNPSSEKTATEDKQAADSNDGFENLSSEQLKYYARTRMAELKREDEQEVKYWNPASLNLLPLKPRYRDEISTSMDDVRIKIKYRDAYDDITYRTIELRRFHYGQEGKAIYPYSVDTFCELRNEPRTFLVRRILEAKTISGLVIRRGDLCDFLTAHTDIPRQEGGVETEDVALDKPRVMVLLGYADPDKKPTPYVLHLSNMRVSVRKFRDREEITVKKLTGMCEKTERSRTVSYERIIALCDPETGEIIEDREAFLNAHRAK